MNTAVTSTRPRETDMLANVQVFLPDLPKSVIASFLPDSLCLTKVAYVNVVTARVDQALLDLDDVNGLMTTVHRACLDHMRPNRLNARECELLRTYVVMYPVKRNFPLARQVYEFRSVMHDLAEHSIICKANLDSADVRECEYARDFLRGFTALQRSGLFARLYTRQLRLAIMKKSNIARVLVF